MDSANPLLAGPKPRIRARRASARPPRYWIWIVATVWFVAVVSGLYVVWAYDNAPGADANAPTRWPINSMLTPADDRPTLMLLAHKQCTGTVLRYEDDAVSA